MVALFDSSRLIVAGVVPHCIAILCTIFRLIYRIWTCRFWWEDAWAAFALILDVLCLACIWIDESISSWTLAVTLASVLWAARMSMIFSIIRVTKDSVSNLHRQITYLIAVSFACMWAAIIAQKMSVCFQNGCQMFRSLALSQLVTDIIADVSLVAMPVHLWKNVGLSRGRKILVISAISSSFLITVITIPHSIILFRSRSRSILIFPHVKAALSLIICDPLVIVTFAYRVCSKETFDVDRSFGSNVLFTSIVTVQHPSGTNAEMSVSVGDETASRQIITVQTGPRVAKKQNTENTNVHYVEDRTSTEGCGGMSKDGEQ